MSLLFTDLAYTLDLEPQGMDLGIRVLGLGFRAWHGARRAEAP